MNHGRASAEEFPSKTAGFLNGRERRGTLTADREGCPYIPSGNLKAKKNHKSVTGDVASHVVAFLLIGVVINLHSRHTYPWGVGTWQMSCHVGYLGRLP